MTVRVMSCHSIELNVCETVLQRENNKKAKTFMDNFYHLAVSLYFGPSCFIILLPLRAFVCSFLPLFHFTLIVVKSFSVNN